MFTPPTRVRLLAAASALTLATVAGCSLLSDPEVPEDELESEIADDLEDQTGTRPSEVDCPGALEGEEDATLRCTLTAPDGSQIEGTASIDEVDGEEITWSFQVDDPPSAATDGTDPGAGDPAAEDPAAGDQPAAGDAATEPTPTEDPAAADPQAGNDAGSGGDGTVVLQSYVESQAMAALEESVGQRPSSIDCPGDMAAVEGTTMRCTLTANDGTQIGMTTEVTSADGGNVTLDFQVDDAPMP